MVARLTSALWNLFRRRRKDAELDEEVRGYVEMLAEEKTDSGLSIQQARREAKMELGGVEQVKEQTREVRAGHFIETLWQDLRYGARMLRKNPGFTIVAVLTLALGIGANTAIFSVIDGVLLSPLPYKNPQQLVAMNHNDSLMNILDIQRQTRAFSEGGGINVTTMDYRGAIEPMQVHVGLVDAGFLETLGIPPMLGHIFAPEEDVQGGPRVAVVSHRFWVSYLGSDPRAVGRTIPLDGNSFTVIGVMPASFALPNEHADLFVTLWAGYPEAAPYRGVHFMHVYWRVKPGATLVQAQADMDQIDRRLGEKYPDNEKGRRTVLVPLHQWLTGDIRTALLVLFGAVGIVLLIACANFAGLLMARAVARRQELVIRAALGAGRRRLIRQALTESLLLSLIGGAAGLLLAKWGTGVLLALKPAALNRFAGIQMDVRVLLFVFGISVLTGILFGLAPAWSAGRTLVGTALKESGRSATEGRSGYRLRQLLVTGEIALALVLLAGAGLLLKGFSRLRAVNPGFNPANVLTMYLQLPATRYAEIPKQTQFRRELLTRLNSLPGVQAAMISDMPLSGNYLSHNFVIDGRPPVPVGDEPEIQSLSVMGDYFRVMQIPIRAGRDFTDMDRKGQPLVAIINEAAARQFFPRENPLGARVDWARREGPHQWTTIVGVAADVKHSGLNQPTDPAVYEPFPQSDEEWRRWMSLAIRTRGASAGLVEEVKKQVWSLDSQIPVSKVQSMDDLLAVSLAEQRFNMILLGAFAGLALVLAAVGIYGVMAYTVSQRTHEIGIRMALGAQQSDVMQQVMKQGTTLALAGIVIGLLGATAVTRLMASLLFDVKPTDPLTFASVAIVLAIVALAACYVPARRAMRVDPMTALRYE
ncbi:MAG TPA: ABC transporter permease [Candidatus Acidoferrales bacterium]|nr:ABC transporter permease [Candidatus Acidoferrales bacterium]